MNVDTLLKPKRTVAEELRQFDQASSTVEGGLKIDKLMVAPNEDGTCTVVGYNSLLQLRTKVARLVMGKYTPIPGAYKIISNVAATVYYLDGVVMNIATGTFYRVK